MATPFTQNTGAAYQVSGSPSPQSKTLTGLSGSPGQAPVHYPAPQPTLSPLRASNTSCRLPSPALSEAPSVPPTQAGTHICNSYIPTIVLTHCARDLLWTSWPMPAPPPVFLFLPFHFPPYEHPSVSLAAPTQDSPCTRSTELCTSPQLPAATPHTRTLFPRGAQVRTHTKLFKHACMRRPRCSAHPQNCWRYSTVLWHLLDLGAELARSPGGALPGAQNSGAQ